jgi:hypothetical protein
MSKCRFPQITVAAIIECVQKSYTCFEANPDVWTDVNKKGLKLLAEKDLDRYRKKFPNEEDTQEEWSAVIRLPGKHVNLLVGQQTDEDYAKKLTRKIITTKKSGTWSTRITSWPIIRLRHMRVGARLGLKKRSTLIGSG